MKKYLGQIQEKHDAYLQGQREMQMYSRKWVVVGVEWSLITNGKENEDFYARVGNTWERGNLLYGPPGTRKSSLIAAMANCSRFDVLKKIGNDINSSTCN
jgi:hypothetical protein